MNLDSTFISYNLLVEFTVKEIQKMNIFENVVRFKRKKKSRNQKSFVYEN